MNNKVFVTGIGTGIGKTVCSAALCKTFGHAYWKPVQCGDLDQSDTIFISKHSLGTHIHQEAYRLKTPQSPHLAAKLEGIEVSLPESLIPRNSEKLCVEGAGGLMVPFNESQTYLDFLLESKLHPVIVIRHYLGSINHSLLTLQALASAGIKDFTIIWNGEENASSESAILKRFSPIEQYRMEEWDMEKNELPHLKQIG
ncbi:dethiobiotin synthase [Echinicola sp. 20G]|uniref:dethiobiotin synthase n=1 Tax=Echinicola sp. 20G TaxID=2781961 RepID=UPI00191058F4|nr:dethiobiotin synthase [Echinicola sp. 20G]